MMSSPPRRAPAALFMLAAVALFAVMDAGLKSLSAHYPPLQVAALRGLASFPPILVWALSTAPLRDLIRVHWPLHLLRGALSVLMMAGFVYGVARLPLTTVYAITFAAPLLVTALVGPVLGEHVGPRRWLAVGVGLLGVLVILRPTGQGMMTAAGGAVLVAACCYAASFLTTRLLARRDSNQAMVLWMVLLLGVAAGLIAWPRWVPLQGAHALQIGLVGVAGAGAQVLLTEAFRRGEASMIAPLEYSALLWGVLLDVALWGVLPDGLTWVGAGIIVGSGLYVLYRERVAARAAMPLPSP